MTISLQGTTINLDIAVVEHTAAPAANIPGHGSLATPQVQYEGFEPSPYDADDGAELGDTVRFIIIFGVLYATHVRFHRKMVNSSQLRLDRLSSNYGGFNTLFRRR